jgi:hypothetical protein
MYRSVLWVVAFVLLLGVAGAAAQTPPKKTDRFVLFNAEYNSATIQKSQTTIFLEKRLFKIDRQTGDTWMLIDVIRNGKDIKYWKRIDERNP